MATALGQRQIDRYAAGEITTTQLQACVPRKWITQAEHDQALAAYPPSEDGYHHPSVPDAAAVESSGAIEGSA